MSKPSIADRLAIEDLYADYVWALDTGDIAGFLALFTDDAVFGDTAGNRYRGHAAIGGYVTKLVNSAPFRGRQHNLSGMQFEQTGDRIGVKAYWLVTKWTKETGAKTIEVTGWSDDAFVKIAGRWLFSQRVVHYWSDTDLPWVGTSAR
jgi:uncharacterized protein (TIGR02246 family)